MPPSAGGGRGTAVALVAHSAASHARAHTPATQALTEAQVAQFHRDGFLVLPDWWDRETVERLVAATDALVDAFEPPAELSVFTTVEQERKSDEYFLTSGVSAALYPTRKPWRHHPRAAAPQDKVRFFFEEGAVDGGGKLIKPKRVAINKIGHNLHELEPDFRAVSFEPRVSAVLQSLGYERPVVPQSMLILKPAGTGGAVLPHRCVAAWLRGCRTCEQGACHALCSPPLLRCRCPPQGRHLPCIEPAECGGALVATPGLHHQKWLPLGSARVAQDGCAAPLQAHRRWDDHRVCARRQRGL